MPKPKFDIVTKSYIVTMFYNKIVYNTGGIVNNIFYIENNIVNNIVGIVNNIRSIINHVI